MCVDRNLSRLDLDAAIVQAAAQPAAYVLLADSGQYLYKGACRNLQERLKDHRAGRVAHTRGRRPLAVLHVQYCDSFTAARKLERYFKSGVGRAFLKNLAWVVEGQTQRT